MSGIGYLITTVIPRINSGPEKKQEMWGYLETHRKETDLNTIFRILCMENQLETLIEFVNRHGSFLLFHSYTEKYYLDNKKEIVEAFQKRLGVECSEIERVTESYWQMIYTLLTNNEIIIQNALQGGQNDLFVFLTSLQNANITASKFGPGLKPNGLKVLMEHNRSKAAMGNKGVPIEVVSDIWRSICAMTQFQEVESLMYAFLEFYRIPSGSRLLFMLSYITIEGIATVYGKGLVYEKARISLFHSSLSEFSTLIPIDGSPEEFKNAFWNSLVLKYTEKAYFNFAFRMLCKTQQVEILKELVKKHGSYLKYKGDEFVNAPMPQIVSILFDVNRNQKSLMDEIFACDDWPLKWALLSNHNKLTEFLITLPDADPGEDIYNFSRFSVPILSVFIKRGKREPVYVRHLWDAICGKTDEDASILMEEFTKYYNMKDPELVYCEQYAISHNKSHVFDMIVKMGTMKI